MQGGTAKGFHPLSRPGVGSDRAWLLLGADKAEWAGLGYYYYPSLGYYYTQSWVFSYLSLGYYYYFTHIYYYYYYYYYVIIIIIDFNIWSDVLHVHAQGLSVPTRRPAARGGVCGLWGAGV